jgi:hypothetical protein
VQKGIKMFITIAQYQKTSGTLLPFMGEDTASKPTNFIGMVSWMDIAIAIAICPEGACYYASRIWQFTSQKLKQPDIIISYQDNTALRICLQVNNFHCASSICLSKLYYMRMALYKTSTSFWFKQKLPDKWVSHF